MCYYLSNTATHRRISGFLKQSASPSENLACLRPSASGCFASNGIHLNAGKQAYKLLSLAISDGIGPIKVSSSGTSAFGVFSYKGSGLSHALNSGGNLTSTVANEVFVKFVQDPNGGAWTIRTMFPRV